MIDIHVCPSLLTEGYTTYSPAALKLLTDGRTVSHIISGPSPLSDTSEAKAVYRQVGRISLSGVQSKLAVVIDGDHFRFTKEDERGTYMLKPKPTASFL